jgi:hypothetical protein
MRIPESIRRTARQFSISQNSAIAELGARVEDAPARGDSCHPAISLEVIVGEHDSEQHVGDELDAG